METELLASSDKKSDYSNGNCKTAKSASSPDTIKIVERAFCLLNILREKDACYGVNELARMSGISPSTAYRILKTIEKMGWVFQLRDDRYILGEKACFVTERDNLFLALRDVAGLIMQKYTDEYNQSMNLIVRDCNKCVIIQQSRTSGFITYTSPIGTALPIYACAGGKVILSELPVKLVEEILSSIELVKYTPYTITDHELFWKELRSVAVNGYAFDHQESSLNGTCLAVPVKNSSGDTIAAISYTGFVSISNLESLLSYLPSLNQASEEISKALFKCWGM